MIKNGIKFKLIKDQLGSIRLVVNTINGNIKSSVEYDEFGRIDQETKLKPNMAAFGFAGGIRDPGTGLVRFGARDYDPQIGRWTAKDPIGFEGGDTNLYGYVLVDPVNLIDPNGKFAQLVIVPVTTGLISGFIGGIGNAATGGSFSRGFTIGFGAGFLGGVGAVTGGTAAAILGSLIGSTVTGFDAASGSNSCSIEDANK